MGVLVNWKCTLISTENCIFTLWVVNHNKKRKWQKYGRIKVIQCLHGNLVCVITCHHLYDSNVKKSPKVLAHIEWWAKTRIVEPMCSSHSIWMWVGESGQIGNWKSYGMNIMLFVIQTRKSGKFDRFLRFWSRPNLNEVGFARSSAKVYEMH